MTRWELPLRRFFLHVAQGIRENPHFGFPRTDSAPTASVRPATAASRPLPSTSPTLPTGTPQLRCCDACLPETHPCGTRAVRLLRYLLTLRTTADRRRACRTPSRACAYPSLNRSLATFSGRLSIGPLTTSIAFSDPISTFGLLRPLISLHSSKGHSFP
jgi:hypothetical protein